MVCMSWLILESDTGCLIGFENILTAASRASKLILWHRNGRLSPLVYLKSLCEERFSFLHTQLICVRPVTFSYIHSWSVLGLFLFLKYTADQLICRCMSLLLSSAIVFQMTLHSVRLRILSLQLKSRSIWGCLDRWDLLKASVFGLGRETCSGKGSCILQVSDWSRERKGSRYFGTIFIMERRLFLKTHRAVVLSVIDLENVSAFYAVVSSMDKKKKKPVQDLKSHYQPEPFLEFLIWSCVGEKKN